MEQEKKDGNYALNTWQDIWKYDRARLLDLGNDFQVWLSQKSPEANEEARATSNFEKLTEDRPRPIKHTMMDATRLLPDIIALVAGPGFKAGKKILTGKKVSKIASKLVDESTTDTAKAFYRSKLLDKGSKNTRAKAWVRDLYENEEAMHRVAGKKLSPTEIDYVKKELPDAITEKIVAYNEDVDRVKELYKEAKRPLETKKILEKGREPAVTSEKLYELLKDPTLVDWTENLDTYRKYLVDTKEVLTEAEWKKLARNITELPGYDKRASFSHIDADQILKGIPKDKHKIVKDVLLDSAKGLALPAPAIDAVSKIFDAGINDTAKTKFKTNKGLEMSPDYWTLGSEPTPVSDFIASVFNVDFDDPARFNKKDIDVFFDFLEDAGVIEPGIKDEWTPRQKVSVMREMLSDKHYGTFIKERWAKSKHNEDLTKYYRGE